MQQKKKEVEEEQAINRQTALYTLKLLCKNFGAENRERFVPVLNTAVDLIAPERKEEKNVLGSALLCIAEVASTLEALAIPQLPRYTVGDLEKEPLLPMQVEKCRGDLFRGPEKNT